MPGARLSRFLPGAPSKEGRLDRDMAKVMVVDDAQSDLKIMESILQAAGHQVVAYATGENLEDRMAAERPDVLLLDIVMPRRNGYDILRSVKKDDRTKHTPVVLVTSRTQESDRMWGKRQGADEYVTKPFTAEQLVTVVRRFTEESPAGRADRRG